MHDIKDLQQKLLKMNVAFSVPLSIVIELMRLLKLFSTAAVDFHRIEFMLKIITSSIGATTDDFNILSKLLVSVTFRGSIYCSQNSVAFLLSSFLEFAIMQTMSCDSVTNVEEFNKLIANTLLSLCNHVTQESIHAPVSVYVLMALFSSCATVLRDRLLNNAFERRKDTSTSSASQRDNISLEKSFITVLISLISFDFSVPLFQAANGDNYILQQWKVRHIIHTNIMQIFF